MLLLTYNFDYQKRLTEVVMSGLYVYVIKINSVPNI